MSAIGPFLAIKNNRIDDLIKALNSGISPDLKDGEGRTLLLSAINVNNLPAMELLLMRGADIHARHGESENTYLHIAVIVMASLGVDTSALALLCRYNANIDAQNSYGLTPMSLAARLPSPRAVDFLLKQGADVTIRENNNKTILEDPNVNQTIKDKIKPYMEKALSQQASGAPKKDSEQDKEESKEPPERRGSSPKSR